MNLFRKDDFKIDYNHHMKRISMARGEEWISLTQTSFHVMMAMMDVKTDFDKVVVNQQASKIEIVKIAENFMLEFTCKNFTSIIVICMKTMDAIYKMRHDIFTAISHDKKYKIKLNNEKSSWKYDASTEVGMGNLPPEKSKIITLANRITPKRKLHDKSTGEKKFKTEYSKINGNGE